MAKDPVDQLKSFQKTKSRSLVKVNSKNKVYCFQGDWFDPAFGYFITAISNNGTVLAMSTAPSLEEAQTNIGYLGDLQHHHYRKHFPNGYSIEWVDDPNDHEGFLEAYNLYENDKEQQKITTKYNSGIKRDDLVRELKLVV